MESLFEALAALAQTKSIWIYLFIIFGKLTEVTVSTLRIVLINRGIRAMGSLLAVLEILLWLVVTSTVLSSFVTDPLKMLFYALAFGAGNYLGSWLDDKLAFGLSSIQVVVPDIETAQKLTEVFSEGGFGMSRMEVRGKDESQHYMMVTMVQRKRVKEGIAIINQVCENAVITVSDVKVQKGGYMRNSATRRVHSPLK